MSDNLMKSNTFYYHPLTRQPLRPRSLVAWPDGVLIEEAPEQFKIKFRSILTDEEIVLDFYGRMGMEGLYRNLPRDTGAVRYMVRKDGLDITLFGIDALVDDYLSSEDRTDEVPDIITAQEFTQEAHSKLGNCRQIAGQYNIGEDNWLSNADHNVNR